MQGERREGGFQDVATWLDQQERRLRALEAENRELRRQLAELRRGVGIAVVIEGRTVALAPAAATEDVSAAATIGVPHLGQGPADATPSAAFAQSQPGAEQRSFRTVAAGAGVVPPASQPRQGRTLTGGPAPDAGQPGTSPHVGYAQRERAPEHHPFPPLATTPEHLPGTGRPLPAPSSEWLRSGGAWPDAPAGHPSGAPTPTARPATNPSGRQPVQSHPLWDQRERPPSERNPFADSFIL